MEQLLELIIPVLTTIARPAAKAGLKVVANLALQHISELKNISPKLIASTIDRIFCDNMQQIHDDLTTLTKDIYNFKQEITTHLMEQTIRNELQTLQNDVLGLMEIQLPNLMKKPTCCFTRNEFMQAYQKINLLKVVCCLRKCITSKNQHRENLVDTILRACNNDWRIFYEWQVEINLTLSQASYLHAVYIWLKFCPGGLLDNALSTIWDGFRHDKHIMMEVTMDDVLKLQKWTEEIVQELERGLLRAKSQFLFTKCPDPQHGECGAQGDAEGCCELSAFLHGFLSETKNVDFEDRELAMELREKLIAKYPQFVWSVVMYEQDKHNKIKRISKNFINQKMKEEILWKQTLGTLPSHFHLHLMKEKVAKTDSKGLMFGQFLSFCFKAEKPERRALIFWTEHERVLAGKTFHDSLHVEMDQMDPFNPSTPSEKELMLDILSNKQSFKFEERLTQYIQLWNEGVERRKLVFLVCEESDSIQMALADVGGVQFPVDLSVCLNEEENSHNFFNLAWFVDEEPQEDKTIVKCNSCLF